MFKIRQSYFYYCTQFNLIPVLKLRFEWILTYLVQERKVASYINEFLVLWYFLMEKLNVLHWSELGRNEIF